MPQANKIAKRFGLFILVYFGLVFLFQNKSVQHAHNVYYSKVGDAVFNLVNPNYYAVFSPEVKVANKDNWNLTMTLYNRKKHKGRISNAQYRKRVSPERLFYRDVYELAMLPVILLFSLYLITPVFTWKRKTAYFFASLFILYIFLSFHYSHIIENIIVNDNKVGDSFWEKFISIFGFRGLTEPLYLISVVCWAMFCFRSPLWKWATEDEPIKQKSKSKKGIPSKTNKNIKAVEELEQKKKSKKKKWKKK